MKANAQCLQKEKNNLYGWLPFALVFIFMLFWHSTIISGYGDDAWFKNILADQENPVMALVDYLVSRYYNWSSRLFSEIFAVTVTHSVVLWRFLDSAVFTGIPYLFVKLFCEKKNDAAAWAACACMFLYPLYIFSTAGWITTTVFYSWPFLFGLIAMLPFSRIYHRKNITWRLALPCVPSLLIACSNEQLCILLVGITLVVCAMAFHDHQKIHGLIFVEEALIIASLIFIFTCPGNWNRVVQETKTWFPSFGELSPFVKFEIGFALTGFQLMMRQNWLFLTLCVLLLAAVWRNQKHPAARVAAALPLTACLILGVFPDFFKSIFPQLIGLRYRLTETGTGFRIASPETWFPDVLFLAVFILVLFCLIVSFKDRRTRVIAIALLIFGLGTGVMIGFSPTVWVSCERTACFLYFSLMALIIMLVQQLSNTKKKAVNIALTAIFVICFFVSALSYVAPLFQR